MVNHLEIQFLRPLASVATVAPGQENPAQEQIQREMREHIQAELGEIRTAMRSLVAAQAKFQSLQEQFCQEAEQQLIGLSMEIARKVLMQEIKAGRYEVAPIVREALSRLPSRMDAVVHLHPDDLARCELASQGGESSVIEGVKFVSDPGIHRGECLVRTEHGTVESSIDGHIGEIAKALTESE
jgi:flagellar assembly protein FliH